MYTKTILIGGIEYLMPQDPNSYRSVINHIDMVKKGLKQFVSLTEIETSKKVKLTTLHLQTKIELKDYAN